jgi:hypothetical protein
MIQNVEVTCPKCHGHFTAKIFSSVNTDYAEDLAEQIITGEFFKEPCPHCGFRVHLEYQFLYHDMKHWALVWVLNPEANDIEQFSSDMRAKDLFHYNFSRIVYNTDELKEKVSCLESGRDDRVIELLKMHFTETLHKKDINISHIFFAYEAGQSLFYIHPDGDDWVCAVLTDDLYNSIADRYRQYEIPHPIESYSVIDQKWAKSVFYELFPEMAKKV